MIAAIERSAAPATTRLLHVDPARDRLADGTVADLPALLRTGDLLVVNDAATLPGSLAGRTASGDPIEARLAGPAAGGRWRAVVFGAGDWRTRTEHRPPPPPLVEGDAIQFRGLRATVAAIDARAPRLVSLAFDRDGDAFWRALYRAGRPVQYAHTRHPLTLWDVQTRYAGRPWAAEPPSAGFALTWALLLALRAQGVALARCTHAAGLSSTGDAALDARLPLDEAYDVPASTVGAIEAARAAGHRVIAVGTSVARALEGAAEGGRLVAGSGLTSLRLGPGVARRVVDGLLTGVHEPGSSHRALLGAFAPPDLLARAFALAEARGYRGHEFGDAMAILAPREPA